MPEYSSFVAVVELTVLRLLNKLSLPNQPVFSSDLPDAECVGELYTYREISLNKQLKKPLVARF